MKLREELSMESVIVQNKNMDVSDLNGEMVMMNLEKGEYFVLNDTGSRIWNIISEPKTIKQIVSELLEEYSIDDDICRDNVLEYLGKLYYAEIISVN